MKLKIAIALTLVGLLLAFALLYKPVQHKEPKCIDGAPVHVWWVAQAYFDTEWEYWSDGHGKLVPPSHWMKTPPPPEGDK